MTSSSMEDAALKAMGRFCWGGALQNDSSRCNHSTVLCSLTDAPHFKNKLCDTCRANGIMVHSSRLRALPPKGMDVFRNCRSHGAWSHLDVPGEANRAPNFFRVINQTRK